MVNEPQGRVSVMSFKLEVLSWQLAVVSFKLSIGSVQVGSWQLDLVVSWKLEQVSY